MSQQVSNLLYASTRLLATPIELGFHHVEQIKDFTSQSYYIPFGMVTIYLLGCYFGSKYMESRKAFDLRIPLALWNAFLCIFSFIGMCRTVPYLLGSILENTFESTICDPVYNSWGMGPTGLWSILFIFSKIPELIDTAFIVLRKKPLIFLHWYHHVTVLLFCWNSIATGTASGLYFIAMNYSVHALMYGYYCLQSLGAVPKSFPAILITIAQIAQMLVGTGICISAWYFTLSPTSTCQNDISNLVAGGAMYASYLYLFVDFAVRRYTKPARGSHSSEPKTVKVL